MNKSLNILVGLDLSKMDPYLIDYMQVLDQIFNIEKVVFMHNIKLSELPNDLVSKDRLPMIQKRISTRLDEQIRQRNFIFPYEVRVTNKNLSEIAFVKEGKAKNYDLLILGNKQKLQGNGALAYKLLRLFPCPVLLIPETFRKPIQTVISAITFSRYTHEVINWGERFQSKDPQTKIENCFVNISKIYHYPLMGAKEAEKAVQEDVLRKQKKWKNDFGNFGEIEVIPSGEKSVPTALLSYAEKHQADVLVLGIKSNSIIRDLMVGSVANEIFTRASDVALLFVKSVRER